VGPGRKERAYMEDIVALGRRGAALSNSLRQARGELESALLIERGTQRFTDRLEERLARTETQKARALVLVGSLQQEVAQMHSQLELAQGQLARLAAPKPGIARRLFKALGRGLG